MPYKNKEDKRLWRVNNRDKIAEYNRRGKLAGYHRKFSQANKEKIAEFQRNYRMSNPEKIANYQTRRRNIMKGKLSVGIVDYLWRLQSGFCAYYKFCKSMLVTTGWHLDHIYPVSVGGTNTDSNVQLLCPSCNRRKHKKHPTDFLREIGLFK